MLVDEHPLVRVPLAALIDAEPDFIVCGQARNRTEALSFLPAKDPDVAIVGLKLHDSHGLDLIKDLHSQRPQLPVIVLSTFDRESWVERSFRAGARGFVSKKQQPAELLTAMRRVVAGELYFKGPVVRRLAKAQARAGAPSTYFDDLPDREYQVLWYTGHGYLAKEVAQLLRVSVPTVETYRSRLKERLGCEDQAELLKCAIQWAHSSPTL